MDDDVIEILKEWTIILTIVALLSKQPSLPCIHHYQSQIAKQVHVLHSSECQASFTNVLANPIPAVDPTIYLFTACSQFIKALEACHASGLLNRYLGGCNQVKKELTLCLRQEVGTGLIYARWKPFAMSL